MKLAEKFGLPVFTFVDTPGAYPGIDAEERGQSEAIGRNIFEMAQLAGADHHHHHRRGRLRRRARDRGGRPGADAAVRDLFGDLARGLRLDPVEDLRQGAAEAAEALGITAHRLKALGLVDKIVNEPVGGAHRDPKQMAAFLKRAPERRAAPASPTCR